jgi:hypothetical protein
MTFTISRFSSPLDRVPLRETTSWLDFVGSLSAPRSSPCSRATCVGKGCFHKRGECWSPVVRFNLSYPAVLGLLVFDLDQVTDDQLDEVRGRIGDLRYLIHSTHSDGPDKRCLRIVFPLSRPVALDEWRPLWRAAYLSLVPIADTACADAQRVYFFPSCPCDASYFMQVNEGRELDVDAVLATVPLLQGDPTL